VAVIVFFFFPNKNTGKMGRVTSKEKKELGYDTPILG